MNIFMHIDVNNAFLSWTAVDMLKHGSKTDIRTIEAVIGGDETKRHGIVLAKSMVAKAKGVKTAETLRDARKKCKDLKIYPADYNLYVKMSRSFFKLIYKYTPDVEPLSIDECFIDYTKVRSLYGDPIKFAHKLKDEIKSTLGFTVNVGIANNTLFDDEVVEKMYPLPIEDLYGCGKSSSSKLRELGINTIGDLANADYDYLHKYFKNQTRRLIDSAKGIDNSIIQTERREEESISNSTTLGYNLTNLNQIYKVLLPLTENVCRQLRKKDKYANQVGVILKDKNFKVYSHQRKLKNATSNTDEIYEVAKELVKELWDEEKIRLVGISISRFSSNLSRQMSLFEDIEKVENNSELDKTIDKLKSTYGNNIIVKASSIKKE